MRALRIAVPVLVAIAGAVLLAAPIGPLPGVFIGGTETEAPPHWGEAADVDEVRLKVPGAPPRVVIVWVVEHDGELHVVGGRDSGWVQRIGAGSPVALRIGEETYALNAALVTEGWKEVLEAYVAKYRPDYPDIVAGMPPVDEAGDTAAVFRLDRS